MTVLGLWMLERRKLANAIRFLSVDAVEAACSGHPGMPMGMADMAEVLWRDVLKHNPQNPNWPNRDRFVLSNGHGSMLLFSLLHLTGYDVSLEDLKQFRQLHSKTPGHPEYGMTPGVETTTGPLGQGFATAVGMALAERTLAAQFNREALNIIDHHTYVFLGDGCLMEGISHEAASFAGTQQLGKLIAFWDDNQISIDGETHGWFIEDVVARFRAYGWHVIADVNGHDADQIKTAIEQAKAETGQPTLIACRTTIGWGSPSLAGTAKTHGSPLGPDEIQKTREHLDWPHAPFEIPEDIRAAWCMKDQGQSLENEWMNLWDVYALTHPSLARELQRRLSGELPKEAMTQYEAAMTEALSEGKAVASRKASQEALNALGPLVPELLGGSADLTGSNNTNWQESQAILPKSPAGNYLHYGVREFGMAAIMNGLALHGGFIPYGGTFLTFADYAKNAVRLSALMKQRVVYVFTHDSIGLGEDGPTHQPVEHAAMLRAMPGVSVWRPCDRTETFIAWLAALQNETGPTCLLLSRQTLPEQAHTDPQLIHKGGYVLQSVGDGEPLLLMATGSEVALAMAVQNVLWTQHQRASCVISMPSMDCFEAQDKAYQETVLPHAFRKRVAIEAGSSMSWHRYTGLDGLVIGLDTFGESAPATALFEHFGFSADSIVEKIMQHFE